MNRPLGLCIAKLDILYYRVLVELATIRLPKELSEAVDRIAASRHVTRSEIVREALETYCAAVKAGKHPNRVSLLRQLVAYPGSNTPDLGSRSEHHLRRLFDARRRRRRPR